LQHVRGYPDGHEIGGLASMREADPGAAPARRGRLFLARNDVMTFQIGGDGRDGRGGKAGSIGEVGMREGTVTALASP
jgi:hypothetical protein